MPELDKHLMHCFTGATCNTGPRTPLHAAKHGNPTARMCRGTSSSCSSSSGDPVQSHQLQQASYQSASVVDHH